MGGEGNFSLISWSSKTSKKLPSVARSSEAAVSQAAAEALGDIDWRRLVWAEMWAPSELDLAQNQRAISCVPGALIVDATSLYDAGQQDRDALGQWRRGARRWPHEDARRLDARTLLEPWAGVPSRTRSRSPERPVAPPE